MRRKNNLYQKINDIDIIMEMYNIVRKNTKNKKKIYMFDDYYSINIASIKEKINNNYIPEKYNIFLIKEPKYRIIMSQNIQDKVINHLVAKYFLIDVFDKTLIMENSATRIGKGTRYAIKLFKKYYNNYKNKYKEFYILKIDISKYFYNIDHAIVKELIKKKIKDIKVLKIINNIIDSTDEEYVNEEIIKLKKREIERINLLGISDELKIIKRNEVNELPLYIKGKGLPIGNMTSQIIATFYLDELDKFIKNNLKVELIRYMDDIVLFSKSKEYLRECLEKIKVIIEKYQLTLNKKSKIYSSKEEIEFLGFRFINKKKIIMKVTNKTKKRLIKKMKNIEKEDKQYYHNIVSSYISHLSLGNTQELVYKYILKKGNVDNYKEGVKNEKEIK